jgi:hypothetical protein
VHDECEPPKRAGVGDPRLRPSARDARSRCECCHFLHEVGSLNQSLFLRRKGFGGGTTRRTHAKHPNVTILGWRSTLPDRLVSPHLSSSLQPSSPYVATIGVRSNPTPGLRFAEVNRALHAHAFPLFGPIEGDLGAVVSRAELAFSAAPGLRPRRVCGVALARLLRHVPVGLTSAVPSG